MDYKSLEDYIDPITIAVLAAIFIVDIPATKHINIGPVTNIHCSLRQENNFKLKGRFIVKCAELIRRLPGALQFHE
ncbi:hypothetical protein APSETT444_006896 [Aspergillus pseudonomiae]